QLLCKAGKVGLEPVLFGVAPVALPQAMDQGVDVVAQLRQLSAGGHRQIGAEVALGHGRCDFGHGSDLAGQARRQAVDVIAQVAPDATQLGQR
ncbi:hypothetical protein C1T15_27445, partial [Escherichia coli]